MWTCYGIVYSCDIYVPDIYVKSIIYYDFNVLYCFNIYMHFIKHINLFTYSIFILIDYIL